jgi:hypothetical protein
VGVACRSARVRSHFIERHPFACHDLSVSLGGIAQLDKALLRRASSFMAEPGLRLSVANARSNWRQTGGVRCRLTGRREITDTFPFRRENQPVAQTAPAIRAGPSPIHQHRRTT